MKLLGATFGVFLLAACSGLGPTADQIASVLPPEVELSADQEARVAAQTEEAVAHLRRERWAEARSAAEAALDIAPRAALARAIRARCTMQEALVETPPLLGLWRRAEGNLRVAEQLEPDDPEIALLHAEFLEADGHLSLAATTVERVLGPHPNETRCLRAASRLRYELGEERAALPHLSLLLRIDPSDDASRYRMARAQLRLAQTMAAEMRADSEKIEGYTAAATTFAVYRGRVPDDAEGLVGEAVARFEIQKLRKESDPQELQELITMFAAASKIDQHSPDPEFNRGVVLEFSGDAQAAELAYRSALERDPEHLPSLLNLAANLVAVQRGPEAVEFCRRALVLAPTSSERDSLQSFLAQMGG